MKMCFGFKSHLSAFNKASETVALFIVTAMKGSSLLDHSHYKPDWTTNFLFTFAHFHFKHIPKSAFSHLRIMIKSEKK